MTEPHTQPPEGYDPVMTKEKPVDLDCIRDLKKKLDEIRRLFNLGVPDTLVAHINEARQLLIDIISDHQSTEVTPDEMPSEEDMRSAHGGNEYHRAKEEGLLP